MRRWRKWTWLIAIWSGLILIWGVSYLGSLGSLSATCTTSACRTGTTIGGGLGVTFLVVIWAVPVAILTVIWFATRPRG